VPLNTLLLSMTVFAATAGEPIDSSRPGLASLTLDFDPVAIEETISLGMFQNEDEDEAIPSLAAPAGDLTGEEGGDERPISELKRPTRPRKFGVKGHRRWYLLAGYGVDIHTSDNNQHWIGGGVSHFIADGLSLDLEANIYSINQRGPNTEAINANIMLRWHVIMERNWSLYLDGGAGIMYSFDPVPRNGTSFNLTPQAGLGATIALGADLRLMVGAKWHHISNANLGSNNPGRDSVVGYAGFSLPF
jgi:lipid A 3-O-deacylase